MDWNLLPTTFGLAFVAELGDKTQLAVLTQTCKYRCPWAVFLGASLALTVMTAFGILAGLWPGYVVVGALGFAGFDLPYYFPLRASSLRLRWGCCLA